MDNGVKKPWLSKTINLNAIGLLISAAVLYVPQAHVLGDWLSANVGVVGIVWTAAGIALRFLTKDKIQLLD